MTSTWRCVEAFRSLYFHLVQLQVEAGSFSDSEIVVMLGENGTGKTTMIRMLSGRLPPDDDSDPVPELHVSYKPQKISPTSTCTVRQLLHDRIRCAFSLPRHLSNLYTCSDSYVHPQFVADVMKPLSIEQLMDQEVQNLSGGELQRVALVLCLGKPADVYLIDEPSAYLDSEQVKTLNIRRVLKKKSFL